MDSTVTGSLSLRRSARRSSVLSIEPTPRGPLKRTRKRSEKQPNVPAVNGSKEAENDPEDEESPSKKIRLQPEEDRGALGDDVEMDDQESAEDPEKSNFQQPEIHQGAHGDVNLSHKIIPGERWSGHGVNKDADILKTESVKPPKRQVAPSKTVVKMKNPKITSMAEYKKTMEAKARSAGLPAVNNHLPSSYPASDKSYSTRRFVNNLPKQKDAVQLTKQEGTKKAAAIKKSSSHSSRGLRWYLWCLVLLVLAGSTVFFIHKSTILHRSMAGDAESPFKSVEPGMFADQLSLLESRFPTQRLEVWKRSKIHIEKHLKTAQPREPVSLILTAGLKAERTLQCLAQGLASSFSSALNASVLHIYGASKASQDSDKVKLDIDNQLRASFEGDKPAVVIHRFEELPPGSTLIFYRYCDHENSAYKRAFLLFTVLMPQDKVGADLSLKDVEERVHEYIKEKLVGSSSQTAFNKMDLDKFSGLWSRISHLILPVVSEEDIELKGC
ncbi:torsin-1A-interacting protein 2-like [Cheilinus undulatus]|uniref:torsin-1A-interacting protein 2-like n=1 Tax=Cheilinus undulatus TaxID=241271 RepID=UPI001BD54FE1|nr:torsin-1A-interacting protein 2-like [Cheilinus undulatus]